MGITYYQVRTVLRMMALNEWVFTISHVHLAVGLKFRKFGVFVDKRNLF